MLSRNSAIGKALASSLVAATLVSPVYATCGGGGGGGMGGIASGAAATVYYVPWMFLEKASALPPGDLLVYWFPTGPEDAQSSPMRTSRNLTNWSAHCVGVGLVPDSNTGLRQQFLVEGSQPSAVVTTKDGKEIGRIGAVKGKLSVRDVEKVVAGELKTRETRHATALKDAVQKEKSGDAEGAVQLYREVAGDGCLFPGLAKKAEKALGRMGKESPHVADSAAAAPVPKLDPGTSRRMTRLMEDGLAAERVGDLETAQSKYEQAHALDPGDVVVMRFLGEFHRHQTGDWDRATEIFQAILDRPADRLSRAVALHGLGKMTIHAGEFEKGVALFEQSIAEYPLAMTYRNLAVYWNSERDFARAYGFVEKAIALDPEEPFNIVFAATYLVELGRTEEAIAVATKHDDMLAASYNLAAIYAQAGDREKMLSYLKRHFYEYEEFDAVRAMEMTEARDDVVFARYHQDPEFIALTALADTDAASFHMKAKSQ